MAHNHWPLTRYSNKRCKPFRWDIADEKFDCLAPRTPVFEGPLLFSGLSLRLELLHIHQSNGPAGLCRTDLSGLMLTKTPAQVGCAPVVAGAVSAAQDVNEGFHTFTIINDRARVSRAGSTAWWAARRLPPCRAWNGPGPAFSRRPNGNA